MSAHFDDIALGAQQEAWSDLRRRAEQGIAEVLALAHALCMTDESWEHHDQTDDEPCLRCKAHAAALFASPEFARCVADAKAEVLREAADDLREDWVKNGRHQGIPGSYSSGYERWLRARAAALTEDARGCDCTELCSMGPTCPGGMLARLPGSGCWRTEDARGEDR